MKRKEKYQRAESAVAASATGPTRCGDLGRDLQFKAGDWRTAGVGEGHLGAVGGHPGIPEGQWGAPGDSGGGAGGFPEGS